MTYDLYFDEEGQMLGECISGAPNPLKVPRDSFLKLATFKVNELTSNELSLEGRTARAKAQRLERAFLA